MSSYGNQSQENKSKNFLNISRNNKLNLTSTGQFNSFKFQHFNNFFNNLFNDRLKSELINYLSEKNNKSTSIFKNEFLNETLSEKTLSDFNDRKKRIDLKKNNGIINAKLKCNEGCQSYYTNNTTRFKSLDKILLNQNNKSKINNKSSNINSKFFGGEINTVSNISKRKITNSNSKIKLKLDINSINNNLNFAKKNNFCNTSDINFRKSNKINKSQQLPKDAANCLLLFLKKNKKYLQKTSKYNLIYKKYTNIIDNIIDHIPDEENFNKKNNYENFLGYYNRRPIEGNNVLDSACLIWNNYNSKSEKQRHVQILTELTKLKGYIEKNKNQKVLYIKDFLNKFNINYNTNQILLFEKFLNDFNIKKYEKFLEPGLMIKDMIAKIFEQGEKFISEQYSKKNKMPAINLKTNIRNNDKTNKGIESYFWYNKNKQTNQNNGERNLNLSDTNSFLKEMERQKLVDRPNKTYSSNYNLIIQEIGKEIGQIETEIITEKQYKYLSRSKKLQLNSKSKMDDDLFITTNKFTKTNTDINKKKEKYLSPQQLIEKRRRDNRKTTKIIIDKLNIVNHSDQIELDDVKRRLKLTEYIMYNKIKNKLKLKELGKDELYEYTKKENNDKNK